MLPKRVLCPLSQFLQIMKKAVYTVHPDGRDVPPYKQPFRLCTSFLLLLRLLAPVVHHVKHHSRHSRPDPRAQKEPCNSSIPALVHEEL